MIQVLLIFFSLLASSLNYLKKKCCKTSLVHYVTPDKRCVYDVVYFLFFSINLSKTKRFTCVVTDIFI